jgi:hypothetical protein
MGLLIDEPTQGARAHVDHLGPLHPLSAHEEHVRQFL